MLVPIKVGISCDEMIQEAVHRGYVFLGNVVRPRLHTAIQPILQILHMRVVGLKHLCTNLSDSKGYHLANNDDLKPGLSVQIGSDRCWITAV